MKSSPAQKSILFVTFLFGLLLPLSSIFLHYRGSSSLSFVLLLLGLISLGFSALKNNVKWLGLLSYVFLFVFIVLTSYLFGLQYFLRSLETTSSEKAYLYKIILTAALFIGFSHYVIRVGTPKRVIAIIGTLLSIPLIGFFALTSPTFVANIHLPKILLIVLGLGPLGLVFVKGKKVKIGGMVGILGVSLLFGTSRVFANSRVYELQGENLSYATTLTDNALDASLKAYNTGTLDNFDLLFTHSGTKAIQATYSDLRSKYGDYESRGDPEFYYAFGMYFAVYPSEFSETSSNVWMVVGFKTTRGKVKLHSFEIFDEVPDF